MVTANLDGCHCIAIVVQQRFETGPCEKLQTPRRMDYSEKGDIHNDMIWKTKNEPIGTLNERPLVAVAHRSISNAISSDNVM